MIDSIKKDLKMNLSQYRYEHSILVAEEAKALAHTYQCNPEKAYIAGLVHDIAKEFTDAENQYWIEKYHLSRKWLSIEYAPIVHAEIGAVVIQEKYGLDLDICRAVRYHTIGHLPMSLFDKILFVADKIGRKNKNTEIQKISELAYQDLDAALLEIIVLEQKKLEKKGKTLHPETLKLLKSLQNSI